MIQWVLVAMLAHSATTAVYQDQKSCEIAAKHIRETALIFHVECVPESPLLEEMGLTSEPNDERK